MNTEPATSALIAATDTWSLLAILVGIGALGLMAEQSRIGKRVSAVVATMGGAFLLSNLSIIPADAPIYGVVWSYLVPLAIPLLLFRADLRRILREAGPTLIAFVIGGIGTVLGTVLAFYLVPLGDEGWKLAGIFAATYIGGSINYAGAADALGLHSGDLLTAGVAADNLVMALYFVLLFALPGVTWLAARFGTKRQDEAADFAASPDSSDAALETPPLELGTLARALAVATLVCAIGFGVSRALGLGAAGILIVTALVVVLATVFPAWANELAPADRVGVFLMQIFFATIGASANLAIVIRVGPWLLAFAAVILAVHLLFLLVAGRLLGLELPELVIASNANMGGPTTAAAMAVARKWQHLVIPAILCGTLGYATATFIGMALGHALH
jgi:uncharacterized membrane protein